VEDGMVRFGFPETVVRRRARVLGAMFGLVAVAVLPGGAAVADAGQAPTGRAAWAAVDGHRAGTPGVAARPVPHGAVLPGALPTGYQFWTLQLNLCNSGIAGCYEGGQSIPEAAAVIRSWWPDVVTLNEICRGDVQDVLYPAMQQAWSGQQAFWAFAPALNKAQNAPYQCANGDQYGIGIVGHLVGTTATVTTVSGHYPDQDGGNEGRAWLCVRAGGQYDACTTHLSKTGSVALKQCRYLMNTVIPGTVWTSAGRTQTVVGGDLNLRYGGSPNAQDCVPPGWFRKGDGSVQHILATNDLRFVGSRKVGLQHTDHPGWLVIVGAP
jgi:hypothetical protein